jgi:hypothetical protein
MLVIASDRMLMRNAYKLAVRMIGGKNIQLVSISIKAQARFSQHRQKQRLEFLSIDIGLSNSSLSIESILDIPCPIALFAVHRSARHH